MPEGNDIQKVIGRVELIVRDADPASPTFGQVKETRKDENLVTTVGKEKIAERAGLASPATEGWKYLAVGKSGTAAAAGDTALGEEVKRKEVTTRSVSGKVVTTAVLYAATEATGAIKEAGGLSAAAAGSLYWRIVFEVLNITSTDSLEVKHTLEFT